MWTTFFAAMPPLSALKMLFAIAMACSWIDCQGNFIQVTCVQLILILDVKRAHFRSPATRELYVDLPSEAGCPDGFTARLLQSMYGTTDAAQNWEIEYTRIFVVVLHFVQGKSTPCAFYHHEKQIRCEVHGDDFICVGRRESLEWLAHELEKAWEVKTQLLGPPGEEDCAHEARVLGRLLEWKSDGIHFEADPRLAEIVVRSCGMENSSGKVTTPYVKEKLSAAGSAGSNLSTNDGDDSDEEELDEETAGVYRSNAMRVNFASTERPELQVVCRELAKGMKNPKNRHWLMLKRVVRFLKRHPRVVQRVGKSGHLKRLEVWVDSNHAGCIRTRKSTMGGVIQLGPVTIKTYSKGQAVIAYSSGEAEYYGLVSGISNGLGEQSLLADWNIAVSLQVWMDATAGIAIGRRRGLGRVKHVDVAFLWVQEIVNTGRAQIGKKHTSEMLADMFTKAVSATDMQRHMGAMGYRFEEGRSRLGLQVS